MTRDGNAAPLRVVVSGGISSGKSTVVGVLERLGAFVIEADRIGHEILEPGGAAYEEVVQRWPSVVVDGRVDRSRLAAIVFRDPEELVALEAISHPLIKAEITRRVAAAGGRDVVLELPLNSDLAGPGWVRMVIDAEAELRLDRAVDRGMDRDDAARRLALQPKRDDWISGADIVLDNSGTVAELEKQAAAAWHRLRTAS